MYYTVYKITNLVNDKIYIGVHKTEDLDDDYMGSGKYLRRSIEKHGISNFQKEYIAVFDNAEDMYNMESEIVNEEFVKDSNTYNLKTGGYGGWDHLNTPEKISERVEKYKNEMRESGKKGCKAYKHKFDNDDEFRESVVSCLKNAGKMAHERLKELYPEGVWKGKKHSEESKQKIGEKNSVHQKGEGNSQHGTCWIYNTDLKQNKKIPKDDLDYWLESGWQKGRKMKF